MPDPEEVTTPIPFLSLGVLEDGTLESRRTLMVSSDPDVIQDFLDAFHDHVGTRLPPTADEDARIRDLLHGLGDEEEDR